MCIFSCISFVSYIKPQLGVRVLRRLYGCISFVSYIKPQPAGCSTRPWCVVYLSFPTSNHNRKMQAEINKLLYIFRFLHQTTTEAIDMKDANGLYIFRFLHQTTTSLICLYICIGCISFVSYIKPQPVSNILCNFAVVYLSFPTSNHNLKSLLW